MSVYTGLNGFAGNLRRRISSFDQTFRSHFHFHPPHTLSCWKVTFWQKWKQKFKKIILTKLLIGQYFSSTTHAVDGLIDPNSSKGNWVTYLYFNESLLKSLVSLMSGLKKGSPSLNKSAFFSNIFLGLVSKHEREDRNSPSRLEAWDQRKEILDLVSKHETERKKFSISSQSMRLKGRNSRSRLEIWNRHLVMLCRTARQTTRTGQRSRWPSPLAWQTNQTKNNVTPTIVSLGYTGPS